MKKIKSQRILTGVIIAAFCCSFLVFIPVTTRSVNSLSNTTKGPMVSTEIGSSNPTGDEWPMFHDSLNHTGVTETIPVGNAGPIWSFNTTVKVDSSPAVVDGRVYVGTDGIFLYCLNASTGTQIWRYDIGTWTGSPTVADGNVYIGDLAGNVTCLNAVTGAWIWNYTTPNGMFMSSPAVAYGNVYIGSTNNNTYCLNASTGAKIWNQTLYLGVVTPPAVSNGVVYVSDQTGTLWALNATDGNGTVLWHYYTRTNGAVAVANGWIYTGTDSNNIYRLNASSYAVNWTYTTGNFVRTCPAVANGLVYAGGVDNTTYCINATDGSLVWNFTTGAPIYSSPAVANGMVYIGSDDNNLYCLNATNGNVLWNYTTGGIIISSPAIANGKVYIGSEDGNVYCLPMNLYLWPSAPINLTVTPGSGKVSLSWIAPSYGGNSSLTGYSIYRGTSSGSESLLTTVSATTTQYIDTSGTRGVTYYYTVSASNSYGGGSQSNEVNALPTGVPFAPSNLKATPAENNITLTWQAPSNNGGLTITGYDIYAGNSSGTEKLVKTVGANTLSYTDMNLTANTTYYYQVSAINSAGPGTKTSEINATTNIAPKNKIGGFGIESLLMVSFIGVIVVVLGVKKRMKL